MKPYILGAIFARGGSKGLPGKNIKKLAGKPLISYAIGTAKAVSAINRLIVSTDDTEIAAIASHYGAEVPFMRPKELATDNSPEILSWQHAIKTIENESSCKVDILVVIPATSPLRLPEDISNCLRKLRESNADIVVTVKEAERNPYFNMVTLSKNDNVNLVISHADGFTHRQKAPRVYDLTTVAYAAKSSYILNTTHLFKGRVKGILIPKERAIDVDDLLDFKIAEFLMKERSQR